MSVAYTSTSFGAPSPASAPSSGPTRHQRQSSSSSRSSATLAAPPTAAVELPRPATARSPTRSSDTERMMRAQYDAIGAFFGGHQSTERSQPSGHARNESAVPTLPEYDSRSEIESLPTYSKIEDYDAAFNRKLFMFGFIFFPLWLVGIIAPFVKPLHDPARDNRSKEDQEVYYANMRTAEMRWARRCAAALLGFIVIVIVAVVVGVNVANHR